MSDLDSILDGQEPEPQAEPDQQQDAAPAEPASEPEIAEATPDSPEPQPQTVPLAALQAAREETREVKRMLSEMQQQSQPKQQAPEFLDPEGSQFLTAQMAQMQAHMAAELSEAKMRMQHGDDAVNAALAAAQNANVVDQFRGKRDAWGELMQWHQREQVVAEVGNDPAAYREKIRAEIRKELEAEQVAKQAKAAQPAPSMAGMTSATETSAQQPGSFTPASLSDLLG